MLFKHIVPIAVLTLCLIPVLKGLLSRDLPLGWQLIAFKEGRTKEQQASRNHGDEYSITAHTEVSVFPLHYL